MTIFFVFLCYDSFGYCDLLPAYPIFRSHSDFGTSYDGDCRLCPHPYPPC